MARWLAIEWDESEARLVVANGKRDDFVLEQAFEVSLHPERPNQTPADIGNKLSAALSARGLSGRMECLVALGRSNMELRNLTLPPMPAEELPDAVRFQALREFNSLDDDWPLDYLPVSGGDTESRNVLAAAISPETVQQVSATAQAAGIKPQRLILRACGAASLLRRTRPGTERVRMLVDLLPDEADLTVLVGDHVVFLRTARLPATPGSPEQARALISEIRRTMLAAQNRLDGGKVEGIYLCGGEAAQGVWSQQIRQELGIPAQVFEPFAGQKLGPELRAALPANAGRFAPLVGILCDEISDTPHDLDFLHPRKRPQPPSKRKQYLIGGGIAAAVVVIVGGWLMLSAAARQAEIDGYRTKLAEYVPKLKQTAELELRMVGFTKWQADDVVWLDELRRLAQQLPSQKETVLTQIQAQRTATGSDVSLDGLIRQATALGALETNLRDERHRVTTKGDLKSDDKNYERRFSTSMNVVTDKGLEVEKLPTTKGPQVKGK